MTTLSAQEFFALVWPNKLLTQENLELRLRRRSDNTIRRLFCSSVQEFIERSQKYKQTFDCYFAVGTRFGSSGGTKRDVYRIKTAWVDIDHRKLEDCKFNIKPDIVVKSGGGIHAYFLLNEPLLIRGEGERWLPIEAINRGLAARFKGDHNTVDVARVLRVPETINHKFDPAREVKAFAL